MAKRIKISSGILNIRLHPHPQGSYEDFIEALFSLRKPVRLRGERHGMMSLLDKSQKAQGIYTGLIATFTKIDTSEPWFDAANLQEATEDKVARVSIPDGLFPNATSFHFLFDVAKHKLYAQTYSRGKTLSIRSVERLIKGLAKQPGIVSRFGEAAIDVVQSRAGLANVFALPVIKKLTIEISKPNADVFEDDFDENVEKFLEDLQSRKMTIVIEAEKGKSVAPNQEISRVSHFALGHGAVTAEGRDEQGATERSTADFPEDLHDKFDPDAISESIAFRRLAGRE